MRFDRMIEVWGSRNNPGAITAIPHRHLAPSVRFIEGGHSGVDAAIIAASPPLVLFSMMASCKRHGIDSFRYLANVLRRLPTAPRNGLTELLPDIWFRANPHAARKRAA